MNVLWLSEIPWGLLKQRHHHLIENFPAEWKILFSEPVVLKRFTPLFPRKELRLIRFAIPILMGRAAIKGLHEKVLAPLSAFYIRTMLQVLGVERDLVVITSNPSAVPIIEKLNAGLPVDPGSYYFRTVANFETSAPECEWLTRALFLGVAERFPDRVVVRFWRLA